MYFGIPFLLLYYNLYLIIASIENDLFLISGFLFIVPSLSGKFPNGAIAIEVGPNPTESTAELNPAVYRPSMTSDVLFKSRVIRVVWAEIVLRAAVVCVIAEASAVAVIALHCTA